MATAETYDPSAPPEFPDYETLDEAKIAHLTALATRTRIEAHDLHLDMNRNLAAKDFARTYSFVGPVQLSTVQLCMDFLGQWARERPGEEIKIVFNSPGGSVMDGLALFDYIQTIKSAGTPIETSVLGQAASMAGVLLQAGDTRVMGQNAYMLIHEVSAGAIGSMSEIEDSAKFTRRMQDRLLKILAERSTLTKDEIQERWERKDWWLDSDEALALGFCDEVR